MTATQFFVKTPKGIEEMTERKHGLDIKSRRVLIMIDGKRDQAALAAMVPGEGLADMLDKLVAEGFITPLQPPAAPVVAKAPAPASAPPLPPMDDAKRFEMARNFTVNTVRTFLGVSGSGLIMKLEQARSLDDLRGQYEAWREAIRLSADGRQRAPELEERLAALLS